ncbi:hypothetical protein BT96DRAFT_636933 [Gymnopus androsaceus JB14]|uniref:Uncharacterized protein n=1 Tax=Gymnopus androsaceus JB14 TaxID=1447944 RepID=A0A6A4HP98_9AGAR|nr:hypothetical protein BT96DRAFT_636933 [Gymnopus androsaceus JB14]
MEFSAARGLLGNQDAIPVTVMNSRRESRGTTAGTSSPNLSGNLLHRPLDDEGISPAEERTRVLCRPTQPS